VVFQRMRKYNKKKVQSLHKDY
jgi:hypothetical protein